MSLEIAKRVHAKYPDLLAENTGSSCYWFLEHLLEHLRAADHMAYLVCKTTRDGHQYTPPGFQPRDVKGLDGHTYRCTGVSHDAIWCDGDQFDAIISANDGDRPLIVNGKRVHASPTWRKVAESDIRPWNPPLKERNTTIPRDAQYPPYPFPEDAVDGAGVALFADFGLARQAPNPQMFRFAFRVAYSWLTKEVPDLEASVTKHRAEWRAILGLPPL